MRAGQTRIALQRRINVDQITIEIISRAEGFLSVYLALSFEILLIINLLQLAFSNLA